jgi:hypothetical protein
MPFSMVCNPIAVITTSTIVTPLVLLALKLEYNIMCIDTYHVFVTPRMHSLGKIFKQVVMM